MVAVGGLGVGVGGGGGTDYGKQCTIAVEAVVGDGGVVGGGGPG